MVLQRLKRRKPSGGGGGSDCMHQHAAAAAAATLRCIPGDVCSSRKEFTQDDFRIVKTIGRGDMGTVLLVVYRGDNSPKAMKVMRKEVLVARDNLHRARTERDILKRLEHPFLPRLFAHFESEKHTFLVTNFCSGGDLNVLRQRQADKRFSEKAARFYAAEVVLALEYLHRHGIIYRDLKPENVLIQQDGHIMLTDFDLSLSLADKNSSMTSSPRRARLPSKSGNAGHQAGRRRRRKDYLKMFFNCRSPWPRAFFNKLKARRRYSNFLARFLPKSVINETPDVATSICRSNSFVGTEEYVAPEVVWGSGHGMAVDWWTFGIFLYELVFGKTPFKGPRRKETFYNILCKDVDFPGSSAALRDLITKLLVKNPCERLGSRLGAAEVKNHAFFQGINWNELELVARPPYIPSPFSLEELEKAWEVKDVVDLDEFLTKKQQPHQRQHQHQQHYHCRRHWQQQPQQQQMEQQRLQFEQKVLNQDMKLLQDKSKPDMPSNAAVVDSPRAVPEFEKVLIKHKGDVGREADENSALPSISPAAKVVPKESMGEAAAAAADNRAAVVVKDEKVKVGCDVERRKDFHVF